MKPLLLWPEDARRLWFRRKVADLGEALARLRPGRSVLAPDPPAGDGQGKDNTTTDTGRRS